MTIGVLVGCVVALACGPGPPSETFPVEMAKVGGAAELHWWSQGGYYNDIVRGSLRTLGATHGDFGAALEGCLLEDQDDPDDASYTDPDVPNPDDGYWYLIRSDQSWGCPNGEGTFNSLQGHQVGDRNLEIQTSGRDCTCFLLYGSPGYCTVYGP